MGYDDHPLIRKRIKTYLSHRSVPYLAAILSAILVSPSLQSGWILDDATHQLAYTGDPQAQHLTGDREPLTGPMRMYAFFDGDPEHVHHLLDLGIFPWWTSERILASLWRPLAALTHVADYALWPDSAFLMHLQSVLWLALLVMVAGVLYRDMLGAGWCAGLATVLYAVSGIHAVPASFLANRHSIIAGVFMALTLLAHARWRRDMHWKWGGAAWTLMLAALLAAESGIATFAYLLSYTLFLDSGATLSRIKALVPYVIVIVAWKIVYDTLGYGVYGSDMYIDPASEPLRFAGALLGRVPFYAMGLAGCPPADIYLLLSAYMARLYAPIAIAVLLATGWLLFPIWRRDRIAQFWGLATLFSIVPLCATFPSDRNLTIAGIGAAGLIAQLIHAFRNSAVSLPRAKTWRISVALVGAVVLLIRLVYAPVALGIGSMATPYMNDAFERFADFGVADSEIAGKDLILVNPVSAISVVFMQSTRLQAGTPLPAHTRVLSAGVTPVEIHRVDANTIVVRPKYGYLIPPGPSEGQTGWQWLHLHPLNALRHVDRLLWSSVHPMRIGQVVRLTGVDIEVTDLTPDGRPGEARFHFDRPLEHSSMIWLQWVIGEGRYERFIPPGIGETVNVW